MKTIEIDESYSGKRLDRFLTAYFKNCSKNFIYKLLRLKKIKVNGKKVDPKYILNKNDIIQFFVSEQQFSSMLKTEEKNEVDEYFLKVVYEDEQTLIVQKPVDTVVIEDEEEKKWVLTNFVRAYLEDKKIEDKNIEGKKILDNIGEIENTDDKKKENLINFKPSPVHRIDRNTNGLVIFAKSYNSFVDLTEIFKKRKIEKEYLAIVSGRLMVAKRVEIKINKDEKENIVKIDDNNDNSISKTAITNIEPILVTEEATLVRATIETGRTHQIRVTLSNAGHPIVNDSKYGQKKQYNNFSQKYNLDKMLLLAYSIRFDENLPSSIAKLNGLRICATIPDYFEDILRKHFNLSIYKLEELLQNLRK